MRSVLRKPSRFFSKKNHCEKRPFWAEYNLLKINDLTERLEHAPQ
jgi:hypothetical protein